MNLIKTSLCCICAYFLLTQVTLARWATKEDATKRYNFYNEVTKINKDGTYETIFEFEQELLKEAAREELTVYKIGYNEGGDEVKIIEAKSISKGEEYKVENKKIEDKPLASSTKGFDQKRQILIPFTNVEVGSKIYLKFKLKVKKVAVDNQFFSAYDFGSSGDEKNVMVRIDSDIPLHILVNDPQHVLNIKKDGDKLSKRIELSLKKEFSSKPIDEVGPGIVKDKHLTWVAVSSLSHWSELGKEIAKGYNKVISSELPLRFQNIVDLAAKEKSEKEQINKVTSLLQDAIQYLGDWKTVNGRVYPRDLATIEKTQLGDCKDMAVSTVAILSKLGYQAKVAIVERGLIVDNDKINLPSPRVFNHAIVHAIGKGGEEYWIDPTNMVSMAGYIFPDIADRWALILDTIDSKYTKIPAINYKSSVTFVDRVYTINADGINKKIRIDLSGEQAMPFTGMGFYLSDKALVDLLYRAVEGKDVDDSDRKKAVIPKLDSRIVKNLRFEVEYDQKDNFLITNLGKGISFPYMTLKDFTDSSYNNVQDNFIGNERTRIQKTLIKGVKIKNINSLNFDMTTPWIKLSRKCKTAGDGVEIFDKFEILKSYVANEELNGENYKALKSALEKNYKNVALLFSPLIKD
ncbi:DUF3857 domain-containing protein [Candidatus Bandiella euplotis]|uniref:DUF3857 domain-containing protein n=1 Tax=Candidatus Bandiella euplotis TaxID=1664265 RepID=A0ABZ0ULJ4_9RICK|nr:DUF3857 domain-containing protein [Candidatus Bandiella woodruffii]WPX97011.1 DUF3857 domain-containing protein [Candidatus Bandiella woodruffii]